MSCDTQKARILNHLRTRGAITTLLAFRLYQSCRLSERIRELEADGHLINRAPIHKRGKRYMAYSLVERRRRRKAA